MTADTYDVVVIGSGAGGGASAWALARRGIKVLLLDAGPEYEPLSDYRLHEPTWEQSHFPYQQERQGQYSFGTMQELDPRWDTIRSWNHITGRFNRTNRRRGWKYHHVRGIGGSTLHFTGEAHRLHPAAMKLQSRFGVGQDWPLTYRELEPYYVEAEKVIGVAGPVSNSVRFRSEAYPLPPHTPSYASRRLIAGGRELGLNWETNPLAILSRPYDGRPGCNYCMNCNRGCPRSDLGSVDVTFIRKARASENCRIVTNAQVVRLNAGDNDTVESIEYFDGRGVRHILETRIIVVSCGAVETPRLLLLSDDIGNESGQIGRHLMETIAWASSGLHSDNLGSHRGLPSDIVCWDFNAPDRIPSVVGGVRFSPSVAEVDLIGPVNYAKRVVEGWGLEHKRAMRTSFGRVLSVGGIGESIPNERTYIDLDPDKTDALGSPIARIHTYLDEGEIRRLEFMAKTTRQILEAAGVETIFEESSVYDFFNTTHIFGTARMGEDPAQSVVNRDCRNHRMKNLYIVDASVFPSSGGGEAPSLTIEAIAIRTADKIRQSMIGREI